MEFKEAYGSGLSPSDSLFLANGALDAGVSRMVAPPTTANDGISPRLEGSLSTESSIQATATTATSRAGQELLRLSQKSDPANASPRLDNGNSNPVIATQLSGKFFVSESPWAQNSTGSAESVELTCYRRNLFNVYGVVALPGNFTPFATENGERKRIISLSAQLLALESVNGRTVKLVCIPERRASSTEHSPSYVDHKPITLDADLGTDRLPSSSKFPISWNRMQFRHATAKNQRRGTQQQTYRLQVSVIATLADETRVTIARAVSISIVVRGSSPGSFQLRKDTILQPKSARVPAASRFLNSESEQSTPFQAQDLTMADGWDSIFGAQEIPTFNTQEVDNDTIQEYTPGVNSNNDYHVFSNSAAMGGGFPHSSGRETSATHIPLSKIPSPENFATVDTGENTTEDTLHTYEYYPLSIDDWTIPIEAIYRPHYIHQQETGLDRIQASSGGGTKRFYKRNMNDLY